MSRIILAAAFSFGLIGAGVARAQTIPMAPDNMRAPSPNAVKPQTMSPDPIKPATMARGAMKPATLSADGMKSGNIDNTVMTHVAMPPAPMGSGTNP
jgi:pentapeptide MXKDX repeat protein